jgi:hypothetical protein
MTKKSLFLGTAALALLVLLSVVGCSNPSSGESTAYVTRPGNDYPYPDDTVFVDNWASFVGLLNDFNVETNQVQNIAYGGAAGTFAADIIIPTGKTVYLTEDLATISGHNITVQEGAKLVLVGEFTTGNSNSNRILARGTVEVFRRLKVTNDARDVADYSVENQVEEGRNTVIGKNVIVLPGADLILDIDDLIPPTESQPNKFTPAQAWAAAGQGNLVIGNTLSEPGAPSFGTAGADTLINYNYTVSDLLVGVNPSATRTYTVTSGSFSPEELPDIPLGAFILTRAIPTTSINEPFRVNGSLETNGNLNNISRIEVGPGGALTLTELSGEVLKGLADLTLRPGAELDIKSVDVTLPGLTKLFLGDGSIITVAGNNVRFKEDTPLALTIGKNVTYNVASSSDAQIDTVIAEDASLVGASRFIVYPGSTFTVKEGVTFSIEGTATVDISRIPVPAIAEDAAITIKGAIEVVGTGNFIAPVSADPATVSNLENLYKTVSLANADGITGRILLDHGSFFRFGSSTFVGISGAPYTWTSVLATGPQIELNAGGIIIRDLNDIGGTSAVEVTVSADGAVVLKDKSLTLDRGVTLTIADGFGLTLTGDAGGGAQLFGAGAVSAADTLIKGGDYGWQVVGADNIVIGVDSGESTLDALLADGSGPATAVVKFAAQGQAATITQNAGSGNNLTIGANTTIALGGIFGKKQGEIILVGDAADAGTITFTDDTSKIETGNLPTNAKLALADDGATDITSGAGVIGIPKVLGDAGGETKVTTTAAINAAADDLLPPGYLVSLEGDSGGTVQGPATGTPLEGRISAETPTDDDTV